MTTQFDKVRLKLGWAIAGINDELGRYDAREVKIAPRKQLESIHEKLREMLTHLVEVNDSEIPKPFRVIGLWHLIVDTWPLNHPTGTLIVEAELAFENHLKKLATGSVSKKEEE